VKYLLIMNVNRAVLDALTDEQRKAIMDGHGAFIETIRKSGELIVTQALGEPADSSVVRVRNGERIVTDGPYLESKEYVGGFYMVECASRERAHELAAMIPDSSIDGLGVEVRPVVFSAGPEE
jgi:hypothetical protein